MVSRVDYSLHTWCCLLSHIYVGTINVSRFHMNVAREGSSAMAGANNFLDFNCMFYLCEAEVRFILCCQNENSAMWMHGPGSRTMSAVPASTYYNFQGQNQQPGVFRQGQQPSQHFGAPGYPNYYHSQSGMSLEHQQQNTRDGSLGGSQGQPSKQAQQLWQNGY
jgi:hypothetical protein